MKALVLFPFTALHATLISLLQLPVGIVVDTLSGFCLSMSWPWNEIQIQNAIKTKPTVNTRVDISTWLPEELQLVASYLGYVCTGSHMIHLAVTPEQLF